MDEKNQNLENNELNENAETTETTQKTEEKEYYERQYFEGDSLRELENDDEEDEYLKAFDKANAQKQTAKSGGLKKQLIALSSVFAVAAVLLCLYFFVFSKDNSISENPRQYYGVSQKCNDVIMQVDTPITISFADSEEVLLKDKECGFYISEFARSFEHIFTNITVKYQTGSDYCKIEGNGNSVVYGKEDFYNKLDDGTRYQFKGEIIYGQAVLLLSGKKELEEKDTFSLWAVPDCGYDIDGDVVGTSNRAFVYPNITRADVKSIKITNQYGSYKVYRGNTEETSKSFFFENAELCNYDQEKFASIIVNCTYMLSAGKIKDYDNLADFGLDSEENATAVVEIETLDGKNHKILIGSEIPSGGGNYALYSGKDTVYLLDSSYREGIQQPVNDFLTANLGYTIGSPNDTVNVSDVLIQYKSKNTDIYISKKTDMVLSGNITLFDGEQTLTEILHNKKYAGDSYKNWKEDKAYAGFKPSDEKDMIIEMQLTNYAVKTNKYSVKLNLVKDTSNDAVLPDKVTVMYYDSEKEYTDENGEKQKGMWVEGVSTTVFDQGNQSKKTYTLSFESAVQLKAIRIYISGSKNSYIVSDEFTVTADGKDAIPNESVMGIWKIVSPLSYIRNGYNYAIPDTSSFSEILYGITTLTGDSVVEYNIYQGDEEKTNALLDKYGLNEPEVSVSYMIQGFRSYIFFSKLFEEENCYYAYASINYKDENGKEQNVSTNIIAKINYETASYLSWDPIDLLDRAAFTMYIDRIDTIDMEFDGNNYHFELQDTNKDEKMDTVLYNGSSIDVPNFRYVYVSVLECTRAGIYKPQPGDISDKNIIFKFKMHSSVKDTEIIFYRVSSTKVIYCINGEDSEFYVLYSDISTVMGNVIKLINGEDVPR